MRALVVGGGRTYLHEELEPALRHLGIEVPAHWEWASEIPPDGVHASCEAIIALRRMSGFSVRAALREYAAEHGLLYAEVDPDPKRAAPVLRAVGIAPPQSRHHGPHSPAHEVVDVARQFIEVQMSKGASPSKEEIKGAVKRAYGPQAVVSDDVVRKARSAALTVSSPDVTRDHAQRLVAEMPEVTDNEIASRISGLLGGRGDLKVIQAAVEEARREFRELCATHPHHRTRAESLTVTRAKEAWLRRLIRTNLDAERRLPSWTVIDEMSSRVFGTRMRHDRVKPILDEFRAEVGRAPAPEKTTAPEKKAPLPASHLSRSERIANAVSTASVYARGLPTTTRDDIKKWLHAGAVTQAPASVLRISSDLSGKPMEAVTVFLSALDQPNGVSQAVVRRAYTAITGRTLGPKCFAEVQTRLSEMPRLENTPSTSPAQDEVGSGLQALKAKLSNVTPADGPDAVLAEIRAAVESLNLAHQAESERVQREINNLQESIRQDREDLRRLYDEAANALVQIKQSLEAMRQVGHALEAMQAEKTSAATTILDLLKLGHAVHIEPAAS